MMKRKITRVLIPMLLVLVSLSLCACDAAFETDSLGSLLNQLTSGAQTPTSTLEPELSAEPSLVPVATIAPEPVPVPAVTVDPAEGNKYFVYALYAFSRNAVGKTTAVLHDIDGCGNVEMILLDDGVPGDVEHWAASSNGFRIAVFDAKDMDRGPAYFEPDEITYATYEVYITKENDLVLFDSFEGSVYRVFQYSDGALVQDVQLIDGSYAGTVFYSINGAECSATQFFSKQSAYATENISVMIGRGEWSSAENSRLPLQDDFERILDMKSFGAGSSANPTAAPSSEIQLVEIAFNRLKPHLKDMMYQNLEGVIGSDSQEPSVDPFANLTLEYIQSCAFMVCVSLEPLAGRNIIESNPEYGLKKGDIYIKGGILYVPVSYVRAKLTSLFGTAALQQCNFTDETALYDCTIENGRYVVPLGDAGQIICKIFTPALPIFSSDGSITLNSEVEYLFWDEENATESWVRAGYEVNVGLQASDSSEFGYFITSFVMTPSNLG